MSFELAEAPPQVNLGTTEGSARPANPAPTPQSADVAERRQLNGRPSVSPPDATRATYG